MNKHEKKTKVLVLGGHGFIGRHATKHLERFGAQVLIGTRKKRHKCASNERSIRFHEACDLADWLELISGVDTVINTVGILRERYHESYEAVHHTALEHLANACRLNGVRLIHISTLGLEDDVHSRFLTSKRKGELALKNSGADWAIVRPSLIDGEGGFGAKWFRRLASWPIHLLPAHATGKITPLTANNLGEALAKLALGKTLGTNERERVYDLGGNDAYTLGEYLTALAPKAPLMRIVIPGLIARLAAHVCDVLHITPYSYGHHDLLRRDNVAKRNRLNELLGRPACRIYCNASTAEANVVIRT